MILHMIQLEPELRLSADSYLQEYTTIVFPGYFSPFLHNFHCFWNPLHSDMRVDNLVTYMRCHFYFCESRKHVIVIHYSVIFMCRLHFARVFFLRYLNK